ncbi:MAG: hypothetical protein ACOX5T_01570 [Candidatus Cryptobacteroides sp.]|jgi:uncharacterized membrane protein YhaH (DUF805 family)|nr:hypothetical protein [Bacteroidota bacterium]NLN98993.1 hypothetical protein [Bacteroidales bacterium]
MRYANILYFVFSAFIIGFSVTMLASPGGKLWQELLILLIGLYFLYRGYALTVNRIRRRERERERENHGDDPSNA